MITISQQNIKPGMCPVCASQVAPLEVDLFLNDGSKMPVAVCQTCYPRMKTAEYQQAMLSASIIFWTKEIKENNQWTDLQKDTEIVRINKLALK